MYAQIGVGIVGGGLTAFFVAVAASERSVEARKVPFGLAFCTAIITGVGLYIADRYKKYGIDCGDAQKLWLYKHSNTINLTNHPHLTNAHLEQLDKFGKLQTLTIEGSPLITKEGLAALEKCPVLSHLQIKNCENIGRLGTDGVPSSLVDELAKHFETQFSSSYSVGYTPVRDGGIVPIITTKKQWAEFQVLAAVEHGGQWFEHKRLVKISL